MNLQTDGYDYGQMRDRQTNDRQTSTEYQCMWSCVLSIWLVTVFNLFCAAPGKPESCFATATSPSSLELSWHKPHDNGGLDMTKYELEYTPKKGDVNWQLVPGSPTSLHRIVCDGLESGTVYKFKIFAVNANGKGSAANFVGQTINQGIVVLCLFVSVCIL